MSSAILLLDRNYSNNVDIMVFEPYFLLSPATVWGVKKHGPIYYLQCENSMKYEPIQFENSFYLDDYSYFTGCHYVFHFLYFFHVVVIFQFKDCSQFMYEKFYVNFIGQVSRSNLEDLATRTVQNDCAHLVCKVYDQYLNFISLESSLFTLRHSNRDIVSYHS